jgi:hypothetical protein
MKSRLAKYKIFGVKNKLWKPIPNYSEQFKTDNCIFRMLSSKLSHLAVLAAAKKNIKNELKKQVSLLDLFADTSFIAYEFLQFQWTSALF